MRTILLGLCLLGACGGESRPDPDPDAAVVVDAASIDGSPTGLCGGFAGMRCGTDEYCDYVDNTCGIADGTGTCRRKPEACPAVAGPEVCGCDAKVHVTECAAYVDGVDVNASGGCDKRAGKFACGYLLCDLATQYCRREPHADAAESFTCAPLPACPAAPTCECVKDERCGDACDGDVRVGLTLTCPATPR